MTSFSLTLERRVNPNALPVRLATKLLAAILMATLVMGLLLCGIDKAFAGPFARAEVTIKSNDVKLGDVFDGVEQHADFVLAPAPQPGQEMVWNEPTLLRIATAFNLKWKPEAEQSIRIRRAGSVIDADTIKSVIRDHLASEDADGIYNVRFTGDQPQISVEGDAFPRLDLVDFNMNPRGGTFSAIIKASAGGAEQSLNLRGVAERMVRVPVLKSPLKNGEIIGQRDIDYVTVKAMDVRSGAVLNAEDMIGATPRRQVQAAQIIRSEELEMPRLVNRGDLVTMVLAKNGMMLTAKGKALEDGTMNDTIKVSNTGSNRLIEARVTNSKEVTVSQ